MSWSWMCVKCSNFKAGLALFVDCEAEIEAECNRVTCVNMPDGNSTSFTEIPKQIG